jgi:hypothetical protein
MARTQPVPLLTVQPTKPTLAPANSNPISSRKPRLKVLSKRVIISDELGTFVSASSAAFEKSLSWDAYIRHIRHTCDIAPGVDNLDHPASNLLRSFRKRGVPVITKTRPWSEARINAALKRGPHKSAKTEHAFLCKELRDMIKKGHWTLLPASLVKNLKNLRISPIGVVPQRDRRSRTIIDYSFSNVNEDTAPIAPRESMQFGRALHRILRSILEANPIFDHVYLCKVDIADGFYCVWLLPSDILKLGVAFPKADGEEQLIGSPLALPMGWVNSPHYFCAATETVADIANKKLQRQTNYHTHRLDAVSESRPLSADPVADPTPAAAAPDVPNQQHADPVACPTPAAMAPDVASTRTPTYTIKPLALHDLYMDDFISLVQGNTKRRTQVKRSLLHSLNEVFRALAPGDNPNRQEPASVKKLLKGDGRWATCTVVLGWILDTVARTIELPPHRIAHLHDLLHSISPSQKRVSTKH